MLPRPDRSHPRPAVLASPAPRWGRTPALRAAVTLAGFAVAAASSGCVEIDTYATDQSGFIGPSNYTVVGCVSQRANVSGCGSGGTSGIFAVPAPGVAGQLMVAFDVDGPVVMDDTLPAGQGYPWATTLRRNASYEAELQRLRPRQGGRRWVGYVSDVIPTWEPGRRFSQSFSIEQAVAADGSPSRETQVSRIVVGGRVVTAEAAADRPVACDVAAGTVCIDDEIGSSRPLNTRDLRLLPPPATAVAPGQTAVIPVTARFKGLAAPEFAFSLRARTTVPGGVAVMNVPTLVPPTDSTNEVSVAVQVPAATPPGAYTVTVTAEIGSLGESRSTTAVLNVTGPGGGPAAGGPPVPAAVDPLTLRVSARRGVQAWRVPRVGLPVTVTAGRATTAVITLSQVRRVRVRGRLVSRFVVIVRRTAAVGPPSTRVVFRSPKLRPGALRVVVSAEGVQARAATTLR